MDKNKLIPTNAHLIPEDAKKVFKGEIFEIYQWSQKLFDGTFATFEMARRPDTVVIIPIVGEEIVVIKQLQPGWKETKTTLPGGRVDDFESPLDAAKRETLEETGLLFDDWKLIYCEQPEEKIEWFIYVFVANGKVNEKLAHNDGGEQIEVSKLAFDDLIKLASKSKRLKVIGQFASLNEIESAPEIN